MPTALAPTAIPTTAPTASDEAASGDSGVGDGGGGGGGGGTGGSGVGGGGTTGGGGLGGGGDGGGGGCGGGDGGGAGGGGGESGGGGGCCGAPAGAAGGWAGGVGGDGSGDGGGSGARPAGCRYRSSSVALRRRAGRRPRTGCTGGGPWRRSASRSRSSSRTRPLPPGKRCGTSAFRLRRRSLCDVRANKPAQLAEQLLGSIQSGMGSIASSAVLCRHATPSTRSPARQSTAATSTRRSWSGSSRPPCTPTWQKVGASQCVESRDLRLRDRVRHESSATASL